MCSKLLPLLIFATLYMGVTVAYITILTCDKERIRFPAFVDCGNYVIKVLKLAKWKGPLAYNIDWRGNPDYEVVPKLLGAEPIQLKFLIFHPRGMGDRTTATILCQTPRTKARECARFKFNESHILTGDNIRWIITFYAEEDRSYFFTIKPFTQSRTARNNENLATHPGPARVSSDRPDPASGVPQIADSTQTLRRTISNSPPNRPDPASGVPQIADSTQTLRQTISNSPPKMHKKMLNEYLEMNNTEKFNVLRKHFQPLNQTGSGLYLRSEDFLGTAKNTKGPE